MRLRRYAAAAGRRLAAERGYSLTEMLVVLVILGVVIGALTQLFVSASTAQVDMTRRFEAQQDMRLALDKLRREIHCAKRQSTRRSADLFDRRSRSAPTVRTNTTGAAAMSLGARGLPVPPVRAHARTPVRRRQLRACTGGRKAADYLTTGQGLHWLRRAPQAAASATLERPRFRST